MNGKLDEQAGIGLYYPCPKPMTKERLPKHRNPQTQEQRTPLDAEAVSNILSVPGQEVRDIGLGAGLRFVLSQAEQNITGELDLYPERFLARYRGQFLQLEIGHVVSVRAHDKHLRIEAMDECTRTVVFLDPTGNLSLAMTALGKSKENEAARSAHEEASDALAATIDGQQDEAKSPAAPEQPKVREAGKAEKGEGPQRVVLTGRIGRVPQLRETPNKRLVAKMPLAVHEGEKTVWHTILFFDQKAEKAAEELVKGEVVTVIGYKHLREVPTRNGMKQVEQIFAAAVQKPKQNTPNVATKPK